MCESEIIYNEERKDLPIADLHRLFVQAGWTDGREPEWMYENFNRPFLHSTLVVSAWQDGRLVGCVRVLSDTVVRSVVYDLVVEESLRGRGIGSELLRRCMARYPHTEWLLQTQEQTVPFYTRHGFLRFPDPVVYRCSKWGRE